MHYAARINIPARFQSDLLVKTASSFLVPDTTEGQQFLSWWEDAPREKRDGVMKLAFNNSMSIVEAYAEHRKES